MKVGVILIGGSLKGIYGHAGFLSALDELGKYSIKPDVILGASAGSIIAAFYAAGLSHAAMYRKMTTLKPNEFVDLESRFGLLYEFIVNKAKTFTGFVKGDKLQEYVKEALGDKDDFSKMKLPLYIAATNLDNYELTLFNSGTISDKVRASTAIPMMFKPKKIGNTNYIDGAVVKELLPAALINMEPDLDLVIVSNYSHEHTTVEENYLENSKLPILEIIRRVFAMHESKNWPTLIGRTKIIHLNPALQIPVDLFHPDKETGVKVFEASKKYAKYHLRKELRKI
jgi:NTE family protein